MEFELGSPEDTMRLGRELALAMKDSEVRSLYLFAGLGGGKTTLARGFVGALPGGEGAEVGSPSFTLCNVYPTAPEVLHADLYRLPAGAGLPGEMEDMLEEDSPLLLLEWPENLDPARRAEVRLDLVLEHCEGNSGKKLDKNEEIGNSLRLAKLDAHGNAAVDLLRELQPRLEELFPVRRS